MASFITTMFVSTPFSYIASKPLPVVTTPIQSVPNHASSTTHVAAQLDSASAFSIENHEYRNVCLQDDASRNARTRGQFKPRNTNKGTSSYQLRQFAEATLGSGSLRKAVILPEGEDLNEWLAVNGERISTLVESGYLQYLMDNSSWNGSRRLLQSDQPPLRFYHGILLPTVVPRDEGYG